MDEQKKFLVPGFYLLFFISGVSGLVYQSLWLRMFTLVLGNSLHSASLVFAAFMCGLGLGAWFFGRYVERKKDILVVYVALELGIALTGLAVGKAIPSLGRLIPSLQSWLFGYPPLLGLFRLAVSFVIMLVPAMLIGGTLPVLSHFLIRRLDLAGQRIGGLYGWNTMGAVAGCAATGFWLLRVAGMSASLYTAVALNLFVALAALALRSYAGSLRAGEVAGGRRVPAGAPGPSIPQGMRCLLTAAAGITGMAALGCEVVWARFLSFLLHNDIYAYYLMLSCVLLGIGLGSLVYSRWLDRVQRRLLILGLLETGLGLSVAACYLACALIYRWFGGSPAFMRLQNFLLDLFAEPFYSLISIRLLFTLAALFLPSLVMGAVFPLICRLYLVDKRSVGSGTGSIYAANTAGAVAGALACGFFLVPVLGVQNSLFILAGINLALGAVIVLYEARLSVAGAAGRATALAAAALAFGLLFLLPGNQVREFVMKDKKYTR
ncbi:MAG: fused MFS/spermidine synthase, partial [Candidatus Glassbacteria bacterium]|nr:fused MFS/spermidine synthase [Candidatus Glassbacteria bacterium]